VPGLVSSGMSLPNAVSTMLIYRLISWLMLAAIGWVVFFFMFRADNHLDPDDTEAESVPCREAIEAPEEALRGPSPPSDDERTT
jgi:hypothetical protein